MRARCVDWDLHEVKTGAMLWKLHAMVYRRTTGFGRPRLIPRGWKNNLACTHGSYATNKNKNSTTVPTTSFGPASRVNRYDGRSMRKKKSKLVVKARRTPEQQASSKTSAPSSVNKILAIFIAKNEAVTQTPRSITSGAAREAGQGTPHERRTCFRPFGASTLRLEMATAERPKTESTIITKRACLCVEGRARRKQSRF